MSSKKLLKRFFGTTSTAKISVEDTNTVNAQLLELKSKKKITAKQYKIFRNFVADVRDDILEIQKEKEEEQRLLSARQNRKAVKRDQKVKAYMAKYAEYAKDDLRNTSFVDDYIAGKHYLVTYKTYVKWDGVEENILGTNLVVAPRVIKYSWIYINEEVVAEEGWTKYNLVQRAWASYLEQFTSGDVIPEVMSRNYIRITEVQTGGSHLADIPMGLDNMIYKTLKQLPKEFVTKPGMCVSDYLCFESRQSGRLGWTPSYIIEKMGSPPYSPNQVLKFVKSEKVVSCYILDMFKHVYLKHIPEKTQMSLFFVSNNKHLYPIIDPHLRAVVKVKECLTLGDIRIKYKDYDDAIVEVVEPEKALTSNAEHVIVDFPDDKANDLTELCGSWMKQNNTNVELWSYHNHMLTGFENPITNQIYSAGAGYHDRKMVCDTEYSKSNLADFKFINQGWTQIARAMYESKFGFIPSSTYSPIMKYIFQNHATRAIRTCEDKNIPIEEITSIDIHKQFSSIYINNKHPFPIHGAFDFEEPCSIKSLEDVVPGQYYISKTFYIGANNSIKMPRDWYQYEMIYYAINEQAITFEDITHCVKAQGSLRADTFRTFVEDLYKEYPKQAKSLVNCMNGAFGSFHIRKESAAVSTDWDTSTVAQTIIQYSDKKKVCLNMFDDELFILRVFDEEMKDFGDMPIYRSVITQSIISLAEMSKKVYDSEGQIIGYSTDAIKIKGRYNSEHFSTEIGGFEVEETKKLQGYKMEEVTENPAWTYKPLVMNELFDVPASEIEKWVHEGKSFLGLAPAGARKSYHLAKAVIKYDDSVVVCYTNAGTERLKEDPDNPIEAQTIESYLFNPKTKKPDINKLAGAKRVFIDESNRCQSI